MDIIVSISQKSNVQTWLKDDVNRRQMHIFATDMLYTSIIMDLEHKTLLAATVARGFTTISNTCRTQYSIPTS